MERISPWALGGLSVKELAVRVWREIGEDDVFGRAAQLAYYFLLALFPLLLFLTTLLGYFASENSELREDLFRYLGTVAPPEAARLIYETMNSVIEGAGGGKTAFGILAALWAASAGMGAIISALNAAYSVEESRPWWKQRLTAILLTIALAVLIITALVGVLYGHDIAEAVARNFGLGAAFEWTWKIVQWPIILAFVLLAFGLIYYFAPNVEDASWKWVTPGSVLAIALWLLVSFGFSLYLRYFNSYEATYGTLGAVIILMLWFYLTGVAILIGGEINSEIEHEAAERGAPGAKQKGEKRANAKANKAKVNDANDNTASAAIASTATDADASTLRRIATRRTPTTSTARPSHRTSEPLTLRKIAVVAGAWVVGKLTGARR